MSAATRRASPPAFPALPKPATSSTPRDATRRKTATNLSIRADLVRRAKALGLNLSELLESALSQAIAEAERAAWLAENQDAIDTYNAQVAERGVFSDGWRRF